MARETWLERNGLALTVALVVVLLFILPLVWSYFIAPTVFEANRESGQEIAEESLDADKALQDYRWFRTQWYDIKSAREQLDNYQAQEEQFHETYGDDPNEWSRTAETRHGRIHDRITGQRNQISSLVAEYNARQSDATRAIFQCGLPYSVDEKLFIADASGVEYTSQETRDMTPPEDPSQCEFSGDAGDTEASDTTNQ